MSKLPVLAGRVAAVVFALTLVGCGGSSATVAAPTVPPAVAENSPDYIIGPGDGLTVFVWQNADLTTSVPVRPDGKISIPLVDDMQAVGKTPSQLSTDIETVLARFIRTPEVTIIVGSFGIGAYGNQIQVVGAGAGQPQAIPYRQGLTLLDVMVAVGLSEFAAGDRAKLIRRVDGEQVSIDVHLDRLVNRGDLSENRPLLPGDVLIIPESRF
jgi:polysaccharide export outer membrane protein